MGTDLDLRNVLERIVEAAAKVVGVPYAALVLVTPDRQITEFITYGVAEKQTRRIGRLPEFKGVLSALFESDRPLRVADVSADPRAYGFPRHHPAVQGLLGVAIRSNGRTDGALYLGNTRGGREFTKDDEETVLAFGRAAGLATENSRLAHLQARRGRWLEAGAEVTRLLLGDVQRTEALELVVRRLREISGADASLIGLLDQSLSGEILVLEAVDGIEIDPATMKRLTLDRSVPKDFLSSVIDSRQPIMTTDLVSDSRYHPLPEWTELSSHFGLAMFVPLVAAGQVLGVLSVGWHRGSEHEQIASSEFRLVQAFADQAALALQQVQATEERARRERWLEATAEMNRLLVGDVNPDEATHLVTRRLREISGADYVGITLVDPVDSDDSAVLSIEGVDVASSTGTRLGPNSLSAQVIRTGQRIVSDDLTHEEGYDPPEPWREQLSVVGLGMLIPLIAAGDVIGVLYVTWRRGSPHSRLARREVDLVEAFASQTALALQRVQSQEDRSRLRVLEDRDRIASDLHDVVIQRLFAVEMRLHSATGLSTEPEVQRRVDRAIDDLDQMTRDVRSTIFQLHHDESDETSIRSQLLYEIDSARAALGFTPRLVIRGPVDRGVPPRVQGELVPAVRDALATAATHASPTSVEVVVRVTGDQLVLTVHDDGANLGEAVPETQVADLATRAEHLGGSCDIRSCKQGTIVEWHVPLAS